MMNIYIYMATLLPLKGRGLTYSGSFYQTCKQLVNLKNIRQYRSVAVVGLPCHISAFKNMPISLVLTAYILPYHFLHCW